MSDKDEGTGFSEKYVKELREENASWRTKVRDLEQKVVLTEVSTELMKHGVEANPKWVELSDTRSVKESVSKFLEAYPQFSPTNDDNTNDDYVPPTPPKPMNTERPNSNNPGPKPRAGSFGGRGLDEVKKDPKARADLRGMYRQLLAQTSNKTYQGE